MVEGRDENGPPFKLTIQLSTFALESQGLIDSGSYGVAALYMGISLVAGVLAVIAGERLVA